MILYRSLGVAGGPHDGSYNVNRRHMTVKLPRNVSDEELETTSPEFEHDRSEPTIMAYYLQRIRLSEVSRDITDLTCKGSADEVAVEDVMEIEARFQTILAELPTFLLVETKSRQPNRGLELTHPHISMYTHFHL